MTVRDLAAGVGLLVALYLVAWGVWSLAVLTGAIR